MNNVNLNKITRHPIKHLTEPKEGFYHICIDYYWVVDKDNNVLKYNNSSWQCNKSKKIMDTFQKIYPDCTIQQIPIIYLEVNLSDYV